MEDTFEMLRLLKVLLLQDKESGRWKMRFLGMLSILLPATLLALMFVEIAVRYPCNHGAGFHGDV